MMNATTFNYIYNKFKYGNDSMIKYDEDNDLILEEELCDVLIEIASTDDATGEVGLRCWNGAYLLVDYILDTGQHFLSNKAVLELGAGTGLCSIVAALFAENVLSTDDMKEAILDLCLQNINVNHELFPDVEVKVRALDWSRNQSDKLPVETKYGWKPEDIDQLQKTSVILASDVIYDDALTIYFFQTLEWLSTQGSPKTVYLTTEKRTNFYEDSLTIESPHYYMFRSLLEQHSEWEYRQIPTTFKQFSNYDRTSELELWYININPQKHKTTFLNF